MKKTLMTSCVALILALNACAIQEGVIYPDETVITHGEEGEMRVWGCANGLINMLPKDPFVAECFAPLTPIAAIVGGIFDCVFFPFKWTYGEITTADHRRPQDEEMDEPEPLPDLDLDSEPEPDVDE